MPASLSYLRSDTIPVLADSDCPEYGRALNLVLAVRVGDELEASQYLRSSRGKDPLSNCATLSWIGVAAILPTSQPTEGMPSAPSWKLISETLRAAAELLVWSATVKVVDPVFMVSMPRTT